MARIRSIHPGMPSDEAYMSMTMPAKAAWPLLWTECDDHGVFEWKPIVLKARIFPADNIDFSVILTEYEALGCIECREIEGKKYGFIRNFCKFQRPKSPSYRFPFPNDARSFVGYSVKPTPAIPEDYPSPTEIPPQMKEEGGSKEKKESRRVANATPPEFEEFWKAYPKRKGDNPKQPASKVFASLIKQGTDARAIIAGVKLAAARNRDKIGTEYIPQAVKWLRDRRWEDHLAQAEKSNPAQPERDWRAIIERYRDRELWTAPGPEPGYAGCQAPAEILREFGYLQGDDASRERDSPLIGAD